MDIASVKNKKLKNVLSILVVSIAISILLLFFVNLVSFGPVFQNPFNDKNFDQSIWLSAANNDDVKNPRGPMVEDLMSHNIKAGMLKNEIRRLLGKPDNSQYDNEQNVDRYFLGHWGCMSIDGDFLIIKYNKLNKITSYKLYTH